MRILQRIDSGMNRSRVVYKPVGMLALVLAAGVACLAASFDARAQPVGRVVSGFPPGGAVDILARIFAEEIGRGLGRTYIVDTRPGATGATAAEHVKNAAPDGNTLMVVPDSNLSVYPHTTRKPVYDALKDFVAVAHLGGYDNALAIGTHVPATDMAGFVAWAKAQREAPSYGSPGAGTIPHFYGGLIAQAFGVKLHHVPYKGTGPAITDLVGGHIAAAIQPLGTLLPNARAGKLRVIAISGPRRSQAVPDVPTFTELGQSKLETTGWFGLFAPAGTPEPVVARINEIVNRSLSTAAIRDRMSKIDMEIIEMKPAELAARLRTEHARWGEVVRASGFTADSQ